MRLSLVVPADIHSPTGGNVYDLAVADALRSGGDQVEVRPCEPSDLQAVLAQPRPGHTLVDGLLACPQPRAVAAGRVSVLVHLPLALEFGLPLERAAELDALERRALHAATVVVSTSDWSARYLAEHHGLHHVAVAAPGVDPAPVSTGSDPPLLVHLAALLPNKDQLGVVAALASVGDLRWRARLAGSVDRDPAYAAAVRDAVAAAGLGDRVDVPGVLPRDVAWAGADLALLPSRMETFGMAISEALARGIPAVVGDGGAAEALGVDAHGRRPGVVVAPGDSQALADALRRWLTDDAMARELRTAALARRATMAGWDVTAQCIRQALARV